MSDAAIDWRSLMLFGVGQLGLSPGDFWDLTPVELLLAAGIAPGSSPSMTRNELDALKAQFPDLDRGKP